MSWSHLLAIRIRKADVKDAEAIAKVRIDTWRTTYQGIFPGEVLARLSYDQARHRWETVYLSSKSHDTVYVAEEDLSKVVGFVKCGQDRDNDPTYKGEVIAMYILQSMQRKGIGKQLMVAAAKDLKSRGFDSMIVWVLADNPSRHFYDKLGGEHVQTRNITIGGKQFQEFGYGWKNLDSMLAIT
jgi:ribosomal protein S18 acetylase RimI-like enzyme